jgi:hypothetical protein
LSIELREITECLHAGSSYLATISSDRQAGDRRGKEVHDERTITNYEDRIGAQCDDHPISHRGSCGVSSVQSRDNDRVGG